MASSDRLTVVPVAADGESSGLPVTKSLSEMTATTASEGLVKQAASQPAAAGANPTKAEYDALLTALRDAGIMA